MTGGLITTVPASVDEAKQMGVDLVKKKGGEMLSKLSGAPLMSMCVPSPIYTQMLAQVETHIEASNRGPNRDWNEASNSGLGSGSIRALDSRPRFRFLFGPSSELQFEP